MTDDDKKTCTDNDALWAFATQDVTPLLKKSQKIVKKPQQTPQVRPRLIQPTIIIQPKIAQARDIDKRTQQKLTRGKMPIEAVLDLHGYTQDDAYTHLHHFILKSSHHNLRCVLVITGKGRAGKGILKARLSDWLDAPSLRPIILQTTPARDHHGGGGAFYIFLRRNRS
jgi:DNA-nicking Smr family endonuclease